MLKHLSIYCDCYSVSQHLAHVDIIQVPVKAKSATHDVRINVDVNFGISVCIN